VVAVEVVHGDAVLRRVPLNHRRPDVAAAFPGVANAEQSGFRATVSLLGTTPDVEARIQAVFQDQRRVALGTIRARRLWQEEAEPFGAALVSVIIPCYNQAHFVGEAIASVLAQGYPHLEVVVVDDGSDDNTGMVAARFPGVRCIRQPNRGLAAARNAGLRQSNGDYLVFLDADDRLLPGAFETGLACLRAHPECAFASGRCQFIAADGSPLPTPPTPHLDGDPYLALLEGCYIWMPAMVMYRRAVFAEVSGFDSGLDACADYDLYLRVAREHPVCSHDAVVAEYRRHGTNMTRNTALMLRSQLAVQRRQRRAARARGARYEAARRAGIGQTREVHYGGPLVDEVRGDLLSGRWGGVLRGMGVLLGYYPRGFLSTAREVPALLRRARDRERGV